MKLGLIACPEMSVWNYHSVLCNVSEDRDHTLCFGNGGLGLALHGPVQSNLVGSGPFGASYVNLRLPHIFKCPT